MTKPDDRCGSVERRAAGSIRVDHRPGDPIGTSLTDRLILLVEAISYGERRAQRPGIYLRAPFFGDPTNLAEPDLSGRVDEPGRDDLVIRRDVHSARRHRTVRGDRTDLAILDQDRRIFDGTITGHRPHRRSGDGRDASVSGRAGQ